MNLCNCIRDQLFPLSGTRSSRYNTLSGQDMAWYDPEEVYLKAMGICSCVAEQLIWNDFGFFSRKDPFFDVHKDTWRLFYEL